MADEHQGTSVVRRLALVVFLQWLGSTSVLPLLPLYLRHKGATPAVTGVVMSAYFFAGVLLQYVAGRLCDRYGRRPVLIVGLACYAVSCVGFLLPLSPLAYGLLRFAQGGSAGAVEVATLATIALVIPAEQRGRASSRIYSAQLGAAAVGPLVGAFIGVADMGVIFVFAGVAAALAAVPVLRSDLGPAHVAGGAPLGRVRIDARLLGAMSAAVAVGLIVGAYESCWTLLLHFRHASTFQLGLSWTLFALPYAVCFRLGGWAADHTDRRWATAVGVVNACAFCAIYPLIASVDVLLAFSCFEAIGSTLALPAAQSLLTEGAAPTEVGRRQGLFATSQTAAMAIAAAVSGALFDVGPAVPFITMAVIGAGLAMLAPYLWRRVPGRVAVPAAD